MQAAYKDKILREIEKIPDDKMPNLYRIIHLLTNELSSVGKKRASLKGIWKGSKVDDAMFAEAKKTLFPYERS
ncbi:MAG: hypothetical protein EPN22_09950 [Nitrospirae bacterium]|nr:MAG: hypothetical protein EPN22_09950 [Nitrospirota bacterium]